LFEIETIRHVIGLCVSFVQRGQSENGFAETDETDVRVELLRDVTRFREWAEYDTADSRAVPELRPLVSWLGRRKIPSLDVGRIDVVVPSAPTVPSYENGSSRPEPALDDRINLVDGPLHPSRYISHGTLPRIWWMFVKLARS